MKVICMPWAPLCFIKNVHASKLIQHEGKQHKEGTLCNAEHKGCSDTQNSNDQFSDMQQDNQTDFNFHYINFVDT